MKHLVALALLTLGLVVGSFGGAGFAAAHAVKIASDPAENAELTESPTSVSATFNEAMQPEFASMSVVGPDGNLWSTGDPQVNGAVISVGLRPLGPAGTYTVNYRATSADGHVVSGSWPFRLVATGTGTPGPPVAEAPSSEPADGESVPVWPFYVGATVIVGAGAIWAVRRQR